MILSNTHCKFEISICQLNETFVPIFLFFLYRSILVSVKLQTVCFVLYDAWVCVKKEGTWKLTSDGSCMAGLGSAWSYIAALLFKLAPTSMLTLWKSCKKAAHPIPLKSIIFSRVKTRELPGDHSKYISSTLKYYDTKNPFAGKFLLRQEQIQDLFNINPEAIFFSFSKE